MNDRDVQNLSDTLLSLVLDGVLRLHLEPLRAGQAAAKKPCAFAPARLAAQRGGNVVCNLAHENVRIDQVEARLLALLDGQLTRRNLTEELIARTERREFTLMKDKLQLSDPEAIRPVIEQLLEESLGKFEKLGLLVGVAV